MSATFATAEIIHECKPSWRTELGRTILCVITIPLVIGLIVLIADWIRRSNTTYRITTKRVEWQTGLFSRRIDGIDLWRVRHVDYVQSFADRLFGLSRLELFSQDAEDPHVVLVGLPADRSIYDRVTAATQSVRQGTIGLVQ